MGLRVFDELSETVFTIQKEQGHAAAWRAVNDFVGILRNTGKQPSFGAAIDGPRFREWYDSQLQYYRENMPPCVAIDESEAAYNAFALLAVVEKD